jgi:uncharacterized membrane protein YphA (DoxX/SURF4 family)
MKTIEDIIDAERRFTYVIAIAMCAVLVVFSALGFITPLLAVFLCLTTILSVAFINWHYDKKEDILK